MKKYISIFLVVLIFFTFPLSASALPTSVDDITDWFGFITDCFHCVTNSDWSDQRSNAYLSNSGNAGLYALWAQYLNADDTYFSIYNQYPFITNIRENLQDEAMNAEEKYLCGLVNRDFVDRLYEYANGYQYNGRYMTLEDFGIELMGKYDLNNNIVLYESPLTVEPNNDITSANGYNGMDGYYDLSSAFSFDGISFLFGANTPPIMFVPSGVKFKQCNEIVSNNSPYFYIMGGYNLLYGSNPTFGSAYYYCSPFLYYTSGNVNAFQLVTGSSIHYDNELHCWVYDRIGSRSTFAPWRYGVRGNFFFSSSDTMVAYSPFQLSEAMIGVEIAITPADIPALPAPPYVPYDDNDYTVIMLPINNNDNSVNYNGDVRYMSPDDYTNYVNNGSIVEGNQYNYDSHDSTVSTVVNNYYTTNNYNGGSYDDTTLLQKIDTIITKLNTIIRKLDHIATDEVFTSEPVYIDFGDCVTQNLPIVNTIKQMSSDLDVQTSEDGITEINSFKVQQEQDGVNTNQPFNGMFADLSLNLSWYEAYRVRIRNMLKIPCWIFGLTAAWRAIRSVFGVQTGGGE